MASFSCTVIMSLPSNTDPLKFFGGQYAHFCWNLWTMDLIFLSLAIFAADKATSFDRSLVSFRLFNFNLLTFLIKSYLKLTGLSNFNLPKYLYIFQYLSKINYNI